MFFGNIAPIAAMEQFCSEDPYLMALAHLVLENDYYAEFMWRQHKRGAFVTLDNSAYEFSEGVNVETLWSAAKRIEADEMALPDVLLNAGETVAFTQDAMQKLAKNPNFDPSAVRLMIVPQGETIYAWGYCFETLVEYFRQYFGETGFTIGVAKNYELYPGGRANLIQRFIVPLRVQYPQMEVHLLGMGNELTDLSATALRFPWLRSTDSVKPMVYAMNKIRLHSLYLGTPDYPGRPENYFDYYFDDPEEVQLAWHNLSVVRNRCLESSTFRQSSHPTQTSANY